jgi:hypothetical protein
MPESTLRDFVDIEATMGNEEDLGESILRFGTPDSLIVCTADDFFVNDDADSTKLECPISRHPSPALTDFAQDASEMRARFARRPTSAPVDDEILLYRLLPRVSDPSLSSVRIKVRVSAGCYFTASDAYKPGYKGNIELQIAHRTNLVDRVQGPARTSRPFLPVKVTRGTFSWKLSSHKQPKRFADYSTFSTTWPRTWFHWSSASHYSRRKIRCLAHRRGSVGTLLTRFVSKRHRFRLRAESIARRRHDCRFCTPDPREGGPDRQTEEGFRARAANLVV